jgi:hypothetical protein
MSDQNVPDPEITTNPPAPSTYERSAGGPRYYGGPQYEAGLLPLPDPSAYGYPPTGPPKRRSTVLWIVTGVALLLVLAGAAFVVLYVVPVNKERSARFSIPRTIGSLTISDDPAEAAKIDALKAQLGAKLDHASGLMAAIYHDGGPADRTVLLVAATGAINDPSAVLDKVFTPDSSGVALSDIHAVDPGGLSGSARCADAPPPAPGQTLEFCSWADHGSLGLMVLVDWDDPTGEGVFRQVRSAVLIRG